MTIKINESNFDAEVIKAEEPVLVTFYASWCRSRRLMTMIEHVCAELTGIAKVVKIDVEESPNLASRFNITSLPSFAVLDHGQVKSSADYRRTA